MVLTTTDYLLSPKDKEFDQFCSKEDEAVDVEIVLDTFDSVIWKVYSPSVTTAIGGKEHADNVEIKLDPYSRMQTKTNRQDRIEMWMYRTRLD